MIPTEPIDLEAFYVVQYWDNWRLENGQYYPATSREYGICSGPFGGYLDAVLAIIQLSKDNPTSKYDILQSKISGTVLGFDVDSGEL